MGEAHGREPWEGLGAEFEVRVVRDLEEALTQMSVPGRAVLLLRVAADVADATLAATIDRAREAAPHLPIVLLEADTDGAFEVEDRVEVAKTSPPLLERALWLAVERRRRLRQDHDADWCRILVENVPAMVYAADVEPSSPTRYASRHTSRILGFPTSEWLQEKNLWSVQIHPQDRARVQAELDKSHRTGRPFRCEYRMLSREGQVRRLLDYAVVVQEGTSRPVQVGVRVDITDHARFG